MIRINNFEVKPIKCGIQDKRKIKGFSLIPHLYCSIFALARKKSGKTTTISLILKHCALPKITTLIIFSGTVHHDEGWVHTIKDLKAAGVAVVEFTSLYSDNHRT